MIEYKPSLVEEYANKLNTQADIQDILAALKGAAGSLIVVGLVKMFAPADISWHITSVADPGVVVFGVVVIIYCVMRSHYKTYLMRLQAQLALCQMKIEEHLRAASKGEK